MLIWLDSPPPGEVTLKTKPVEATPHFEKAIAILKEIKADNELAFAYSDICKI